jgi:hypothetical protein
MNLNKETGAESAPPDEKRNEDGLPPHHQRNLPIEADNARRQRIGGDTTEHPSDGYIDDPDIIDAAMAATTSDEESDSPVILVESSYAYDLEALKSLDERDIFDAMQFETELKGMFGLIWIDDELRDPLEAALEQFHEMLEEGSATVPGMFATSLKVFLKGHLRAFGRYYTGKDPWPRPSAVVQAEIDQRMPYALNWLRVELEEALEEERSVSPAQVQDENETKGPSDF